MLKPDELTKAVREGVKAADVCSAICRIGGEPEEATYVLFHNGRSDGDTDVQKVYDLAVLSMSVDQLALRVKGWLVSTHKRRRFDLNKGTEAP